MCFGGSKPPAPKPVTPAPAPAPAEPPPQEAEVGAARKEEENSFGSAGPSTRVDRSSQGGLGGGSGLNI